MPHFRDITKCTPVYIQMYPRKTVGMHMGNTITKMSRLIPILYVLDTKMSSIFPIASKFWFLINIQYHSNATSHSLTILQQVNGLSWVSLESSSSKTRFDAQQHSSCWWVLNSSLWASLFTWVALKCSTYVRIACYICTGLFKQLLTVLPALITNSYSGLKNLGIRFVLCHQITTFPTYQMHTRSHHMQWLMYNNCNYVWKMKK